MKDIEKVKPFFKWVGGKGQLLRTFNKFYPESLINGKIRNYFEPFLGGGAVFFDIAKRFKIKSAFLFDINPELILTYSVIQKDVNKMISFLFEYEKDYLKLDIEKRKEFYYEFRHKFNLQRCNIDFDVYSESWISRAAQNIFLNKTCYNGLFRVNSQGAFNSPAGRYVNPKILNEENLLSVSKLLGIAEIKKAGFSELEKSVKNKTSSFIYFDPPYRPISRTASFTSYSSGGFKDAEQLELASLYSRLSKKGIKLMLSNSDPRNINPDDSFFDDAYKDFVINRVPAKRVINSKASGRGEINEIIVTNYEVPVK